MQKAIAPGAVIERRYQIQKKISDNTCNCCYLAEDASQSNRLVVLSFPRIELLILPGFASAFKDACDNLANSRISGLVKVLGSGSYESQPYVVLPNITHESLETVFQRNITAKQKVSVESVLDWAAPLAVFLDELHEADYIHSNIRPSSVYVDSQKLLLGDFITEFALQRMGKFKNAISTLDVSDYLAPEYLKSFYTPGYDQYLLGTLIYEALAGQPPFLNNRGGEVYRMHVATKVAEPLTEYRPDLAEVSDVLAKSLGRNPANRYKSCRELISQLQDVQVVKPVVAAVSPKVVALKPALREVPPPVIDESSAEPIITSIRQEKGVGKSKKGLMWLGVLLLGSAAVAYSVISQNGADQITSSGSRTEAPSGDDVAAVPVTIVDVTKTTSDESASRVGAKVDNQASDLATSDRAEKSDPINSGQLKGLIEKEALLAHQELTTPAVVSTDTVQTADVKSRQTSQVKDLSGLTSIVNQAVNAGQKDFLESKKGGADSTTDQASAANSETGIVDANSTTDNTVIESSGSAEEKLLAQERLNRELLAAQALVRSREAQARSAAARVAAEKANAARNAEAEKTAQSPANSVPTPGADEVEVEEPVNQPIAVGRQARVNQTIGEVDPSQSAVEETEPSPVVQKPQLSERERIRSFKQKELARIKAVTDDCTVGGKIHREAAAGNLSFVKACMAVGVDPNLAQSNRWTLLHIAARSGHLNMSKLLLAKGAKVNAKSSDGQTPLDMAIAQRKTKVVNYLKTRGGVKTR